MLATPTKPISSIARVEGSGTAFTKPKENQGVVDFSALWQMLLPLVFDFSR
jgi:hypothetical protein